VIVALLVLVAAGGAGDRRIAPALSRADWIEVRARSWQQPRSCAAVAPFAAAATRADVLELRARSWRRAVYPSPAGRAQGTRVTAAACVPEPMRARSAPFGRHAPRGAR
jgi:hypothetical protein